MDVPRTSQYIPIPYIHGLHQRLQHMLPANVKLAPRTHNQICMLFSNVKDVVPILSQSNVIYNIPCKTSDPNGCSSIYIGMTSTSLQTRFTNHKFAIKHSHLGNSLFAHISQQLKERVIDFDHATILDRTHCKSKLAIREAWRIHTGKNLMNLEKDCSSLPGPYRGLAASRGTQVLGVHCAKNITPTPQLLSIVQVHNHNQHTNETQQRPQAPPRRQPRLTPPSRTKTRRAPTTRKGLRPLAHRQQSTL